MTAVVPAPNQRVRQREASRGRLLEAAIAAFAESGFEGASTHAIARDAGLRQSLIRYHFGGKSGLWKAAVDTVWGRIDAAMNAAVPGEPGCVDAAWVRRGLSAYLHAVAQHPEYLRILLPEMAQPGPRLEWLVAQHTRRHGQRGMAFLASAQRAGLIPRVPLVNLAYSIFGAVAIVVAGAPEVEQATGEEPLSETFLERHVDTLMALLFAQASQYGIGPIRQSPEHHPSAGGREHEYS